MFALCAAMEWNHLPVAGGLYDQHPKLLDDFSVIFQAKAQKERADQADQEAKLNRMKK